MDFRCGFHEIHDSWDKNSVGIYVYVCHMQAATANAAGAPDAGMQSTVLGCVRQRNERTVNVRRRRWTRIYFLSSRVDLNGESIASSLFIALFSLVFFFFHFWSFHSTWMVHVGISIIWHFILLYCVWVFIGRNCEITCKSSEYLDGNSTNFEFAKLRATVTRNRETHSISQTKREWVYRRCRDVETLYSQERSRERERWLLAWSEKSESNF